MRRQVTTSSGRAIRFPKLSMDESPVKVDILQSVGTAFLVLRPGESQYNLSFNCPGDQKPMCAEFVLRESEIKKNGDMVKDDLTKPCNKTAAKDAKDYLEMHRIFQVLQALVEVLIKDRPERPYEYMAEHLISRCRANGSPNTDASPCVNDKPEEKIAVRKVRDIEELRSDLRGKIQKSSEDGSFKLSLKNAQTKKKAKEEEVLVSCRCGANVHTCSPKKESCRCGANVHTCSSMDDFAASKKQPLQDET